MCIDEILCNKLSQIDSVSGDETKISLELKAEYEKLADEILVSSPDTLSI